MTENFSNEYQTTLNGAINNSVTSLVVTNATGSPTANFRIRIDDEYLLVTAKAGTTFTVTREVEGSAAASHADLAVVTHVLTAGGLNQALSETTGGGSELPIDAAAIASVGSGDLFAGTSLDGGWSQLQTNTVTTDRTADGALGFVRTGAASTQWRGLKRSFAPAGDFTVYAKMLWSSMVVSFGGVGIFAGETDPSDAAGADRAQLVIYSTNATTWTSQLSSVAAGTQTNSYNTNVDVAPIQLIPGQFPLWLRLKRVGTTYTAGYSQDGAIWRDHTTTLSFSNTINTIGLMVLKQTTGDDQSATYRYIATTG